MLVISAIREVGVAPLHVRQSGGIWNQTPVQLTSERIADSISRLAGEESEFQLIVLSLLAVSHRQF